MPPPKTAGRWLRLSTGNVMLPLGLAWALVYAINTRQVAEHPPVPVLRARTLAPVHLQVTLPGTWAGIEEPLLASGVSGHATFVYIRLLLHARARVGVEFWGFLPHESAEFDLPAPDARISVACSLPSFYPPEGSSEWGLVSAPEQRHLRNHYIVSVNGVVRVAGDITYPQPDPSAIYVGTNPLGGGRVANVFSGQVVVAPAVP